MNAIARFLHWLLLYSFALPPTAEIAAGVATQPALRTYRLPEGRSGVVIGWRLERGRRIKYSLTPPSRGDDTVNFTWAQPVHTLLVASRGLDAYACRFFLFRTIF